MRSERANAHSFIVRFWQEPREIPGARPEWRGSVEHVATGARRYLKELQELAGFILTHTGPWREGPDRTER